MGTEPRRRDQGCGTDEWFLGGGRRTSRHRQSVARGLRGTRLRAKQSRQRQLGSLESVDETIRLMGSRQETQHHVTALAARIVRPEISTVRGRIYEKRSATLLPGDIKSRILAQCYLENRQYSEPVAVDADAFVKGKRSEGSGPQGADVCKNCGKKGHWARYCRGPGGGAEKGTKGDDGKRSSKGVTVAGLKHVGRQFQRNQQNKVITPRSREAAGREGIDKLKVVQSMLRGPMS